jgi:hypothetical protein
MGKSSRLNAKRLKALGLIDYDLRRPLSRGQKSRVTKLAKQYSGAIDHPDDYAKRNVSAHTADLLKESGYQVFKSKRTGKYKAVIPSRGTTAVKIKNDRLIRQFDTHRETSMLFLRHDIFEVLQREAEKQELLYGDEPYLSDKFFTIKIGESSAWKHFRTPADLLNYITDWQPKDTLNPNSKEFGNRNLKGELITQMALIERDDSKAVSYDRRGNRE